MHLIWTLRCGPFQVSPSCTTSSTSPPSSVTTSSSLLGRFIVVSQDSFMLWNCSSRDLTSDRLPRRLKTVPFFIKSCTTLSMLFSSWLSTVKYFVSVPTSASVESFVLLIFWVAFWLRSCCMLLKTLLAVSMALEALTSTVSNALWCLTCLLHSFSLKLSRRAAASASSRTLVLFIEIC